MTALNVIKSKRRKEIILVTDGANYHADGRLTLIAPKVHLMPHFSGFVMHSGGSAWDPAILSVFSSFASSTDDLFKKAGTLLYGVSDKYAGLSNEPIGRVIFGGWSDSRDDMRLGVVFSEEAADIDQDDMAYGKEIIQPIAYRVQELIGDQLLCQPTFEQRVWIEGWGGPVYNVDDITDFDRFASFLLTAQREIGVPYRGVGGFGQITRITKDESTVRIFERFPDVVGEIMQPIKADWRAKGGAASASNVNVDGLSRLQRERMLKKAKKGTLRAV